MPMKCAKKGEPEYSVASSPSRNNKNEEVAWPQSSVDHTAARGWMGGKVGR